MDNQQSDKPVKKGKAKRATRRKLKTEGKEIPDELLPLPKIRNPRRVLVRTINKLVAELEGETNTPGDSQKVESPISEKPLPAHLTGEGNHPRGESGLGVRTERNMVLRAANWQQKNRVPIEKAVVNGKIVDAVNGKLNAAEEIFVETMKAIKSDDPRLQSIGIKGGIELIRTVQRDDHAKLRAELRPTQIITQPVVVDQSVTNVVDHRRFIYLIPDNGRDPQLKAVINE